MTSYDIIATHFQSTIESIAMSVDQWAADIERASQLMVDSLLADNKVVTCGNGIDGALAQIFVTRLLSQYEHERPALPALALSSDATSVAAIAQANSVNDVYARQLRALGQPGDVLLCISGSGATANLVRAIQAAYERNMQVVILSNANDDAINSILREEDIQLRIDSQGDGQLTELKLMAIHCFCTLIDHGIFGSYHQD